MRPAAGAILLFLLLANLSFCAYTGRMVAVVEKEWNIISNGTLRDVTLDSFFIAESPYQEILQMNVTDGELVRDGNAVKLMYRSPSLQTPKKITATAIVKTEYMPSMSSNPPLVNRTINGSQYTRYTPGMASFARSHTSESAGQLEAMVVLTDWVHKNVEYNTEYWGSSSPAEEVYSNRGAVCVGYTHLLISLANSIGVEGRYVSGYVFSGPLSGAVSSAEAGGWQEHAWAEFLIGDQWIPADPTFQEFGYLDARHIASSYSQDQSGAVDRLAAKGGPFSFDTIVRIRTLESTQFPPLANAYAAFDGTEFSVVVSNPGAGYVTPTYTVILPPYIHSEESGILFLAPGARKILSYQLNTDSLGSGSYMIPYLISMQGTEMGDSISFSRGGANPPTPSEDAAACPVASVLFITFLFSFAKSRKAI